MGKLLFMSPLPSRRVTSTESIDIQEKVLSVLKELRLLMGLMDQMAIKVGLMDRLFSPDSLGNRFEARRIEILRQINRVRTMLAALSALYTNIGENQNG